VQYTSALSEDIHGYVRISSAPCFHDENDFVLEKEPAQLHDQATMNLPSLNLTGRNLTGRNVTGSLLRETNAHVGDVASNP
jgi:hypothetical protein